LPQEPRALEWGFDQQGIAKDTHDLDDRPAKFEVVFNDCNQTIGDDSDMYLYFDSILRFSPKGFDSEMLLNPFEDAICNGKEGQCLLP